MGVGAVVRGASIGDGASIGAGSTVEPGSSIEAGAAVAPGAYVPAGTIVPAGMMFTSTGVVPLGQNADALKKAAAALSASATAHSAEVGKTWKEIAEEKASFGWAEVKPKTLDDEFGLLEQPLEKVGAPSRYRFLFNPLALVPASPARLVRRLLVSCASTGLTRHCLLWSRSGSEEGVDEETVSGL